MALKLYVLTKLNLVRTYGLACTVGAVAIEYTNCVRLLLEFSRFGCRFKAAESAKGKTKRFPTAGRQANEHVPSTERSGYSVSLLGGK